MPLSHGWNWTLITIATILALSLIGWFAVDRWSMRLGSVHQGTPPPPMVDNAVLRIDSNLIRAQIVMEELVYTENPAELAAQVKAVDQLEKAIYKGFEALAGKVPRRNPQYLKALSLFREWKKLRDQIIGLLKSGQTPQAQKLVLGRCASHVQKIRDALTALEGFAQKRTEDFATDAYDAAQEKQPGR